ncbi:AraC family transcriptional regulator [Thalassospira sp. MCCC 1A02491]|uniref:helix-turn-helix domain-containing protein n=1 Tax=Thalassospira sp. MCCC 1A02491 TaxID=1769751 RepID=UPI0007AD747B|nr:AraC family transcriptional regulator [Thalassospira sp. MCCC 1A02491]KZB58964.1 transcriptional regulator [Thalassospira sp. MCCC 1A02491]MEE3045753.1 AraC family transcriptional regulator [Pseudomonadota bacterium]RCK26086.1 transcriptional regulator [Thalassospira profundimaris]
MTFHPQMTSRIEGISLLDDLRFRRWNAAITDLWHVECEQEAGGTYVSRAPLLVAILDCIGDSQVNVRTSRDNTCTTDRKQGCLYYVPAGMEISSEILGKCRLRHLDIHLDVDALENSMGNTIDLSVLETPRMGFCDPRINTLVRLLANDLENGMTGPQIYGEGLVTALTAALLTPSQTEEPQRKRGKLAPYQLRKTVDYIEQNCGRTIRLDELAQLTGLSQSYFCSAFRESTGMPPQQWQMKARVERAKNLLKKGDTPLASVAVGLGFADQAHLTRVFRKIVGTTPGAWRKEQLA